MEIIVDKFKLYQKAENAIYILTHAHLDHNSIPKKFNSPVYCSPFTAQIMDLIEQAQWLKPILVPNTWIEIENTKIFVFDSDHCFGSIGFYCNGLLYFGDSRPTSQSLTFIKYNLSKYKINKLKKDSFFKKTITPQKKVYSVPSVEESQAMIKHLVHQHAHQRICIVISHFGSLSALSNLGYNVVFSSVKNNASTPSKICQFVVDKQFSNTTKKARKTIYVSLDLPRSQEEIFIIHLSTLWWFFTNKQANQLHKPFLINNSYARVFLCNHASLKENKTVTKTFLKSIN